MNRTFLRNIKNHPFYLVLLPIFFALHGFVENIDIVFAKDAMRLAGWYILVALVLFSLMWLLFRNGIKAGIFSFLLLAFNFFFGAIHDALKSQQLLPFLGRYTFILPFFLVFFTWAFIRIRRSRKDLTPVAKYLNLLFVLLIAIDLVQLNRVYFNKQKKATRIDNELRPCADCPTPDIYLIIADGYPSNTVLKEAMGADNEPFTDELRKRGFFVADSSTSNYNVTTISMASLLDMNYMDQIGGTYQTYMKDVATALDLLRSGRFPAFLRSHGYRIYNHSIFDLQAEPSVSEPTFLPKRTSTITAQTFVHRILDDLGFHLIDKFNIKFVIRLSRNADLRNNKKLTKNTLKTAALDRHPKFVYTHLMMPHHPYYFDSSGNQRPPESLTPGLITDTAAFVSYVKYTNDYCLTLVDEILASSSRPPIIILASDHGFRNFVSHGVKKYHFMNLISIYKPDRDYQSYYHRMSNVNLFRVLLNDQFKQQLPLLKDSTIFLLDRDLPKTH
jgi:hypothetical protein